MPTSTQACVKHCHGRVEHYRCYAILELHNAVVFDVLSSAGFCCDGVTVVWCWLSRSQVLISFICGVSAAHGRRIPSPRVGGMWQHYTQQAPETMFLIFILRTALGSPKCTTADRNFGKSMVLNVTRYMSTDINQNRHNRSIETQRFEFLQRLRFRVLWSPGVTPSGLAGHQKITWVLIQRAPVWICILLLGIKTCFTGGVYNFTCL